MGCSGLKRPKVELEKTQVASCKELRPIRPNRELHFQPQKYLLPLKPFLGQPGSCPGPHLSAFPRWPSLTAEMQLHILGFYSHAILFRFLHHPSI